MSIVWLVCMMTIVHGDIRRLLSIPNLHTVDAPNGIQYQIVSLPLDSKWAQQKYWKLYEPDMNGKTDYWMAVPQLQENDTQLFPVRSIERMHGGKLYVYVPLSTF